MNDRLTREQVQTIADGLRPDEASRAMGWLADAVLALMDDRDRLLEREQHWADVLHVADRGQYRADWDTHIRRIVGEKEAAEAEVARLLPVVEFMAKERGSMAAHEKYDKARKMARAALGEQS
jgi:hypothetical protein